MSAETPDLAKGLANFLSQQWEEEVRVDGLSLATAGARRLNILFKKNLISENGNLLLEINNQSPYINSIKC